MKYKPQNEFVEDIMNSLDGLKRAEPAPFFFTRLMARFEKTKTFWERSWQLITRPAIAIAGIVSIILVNIALMIVSTQTSAKVEDDQQAIADDYSVSVVGIYDDENGDLNEQ